MNIYIVWMIGVFVISAACGLAFIPAILNFCKSKKLYDMPNARKVHQNAVPRLGGIAFMPSMFIAFAVALLGINSTQKLVSINVWSFYFMISIFVVYVTGIVDDVLGLSACVKFAVQVAAASLLPIGNLYLNNFYGFMGIHEIPYAVGFPLTVLVIVFIENAVNLIDGIDGLAASLSILAFMGFIYIFAVQGIWSYAILISGLIGVLVAFLYFNLFGDASRNRKIFMGDAGSLTLGMILGVLCVKYSMYNDKVILLRQFDFILPYTLLIVPVFDAVRVSLVRICHRTSPFKADKRHIHHKLMCAGLSQRGALACIVGIAVAYVALNCVLLQFVENTIVFVVDILVYIGLNLVLNLFIRSKDNALARP